MENNIDVLFLLELSYPLIVKRIVQFLAIDQTDNILNTALELVGGFATLGPLFVENIVEGGAIDKILLYLQQQVGSTAVIADSVMEETEEDYYGEESGEINATQKCVECLGNIASCEDLEFRDRLLRSGLIEVLQSHFHPHTTTLSPSMFTTICWLLSALSGGEPIPSHTYLQSLAPYVVNLFLHAIDSAELTHNEDAICDLLNTLKVCCALQPLPIYTDNSGLTVEGLATGEVRKIKTHVSCVSEILFSFGDRFSFVFSVIVPPTASSSNNLQRACLRMISTMVTSAESDELVEIVSKIPFVSFIVAISAMPARNRNEALSILQSLVLNVPHDAMNIDVNLIVEDLKTLSNVVDANSQILISQIINHFTNSTK